MGYIIYNNSATKAPEYSCSVEGTPAWSGVEASQFTPALEKDLQRFIAREASRQGHNDSLHNRVPENATFFHADFLGGWPQRLWQQHYDTGVEEQRNPPN